MALANGAEFAGYRIIRLIGAGGMGEVYLAEHPRLPRKDALKILARDLSSGEFRERFIREADLAAKLFHPNIVGVHDRGDDNGQLWIAMDYVDGPDAAKLLRLRYPAGMPVDELITIIEPVASALDYAHRNGLLHRDVKPANILLAAPEEDGQRVFLADFGISRQLGEISGLTATNLTLGTVAYCAPEQLMGSQIDGRADQYALGATAFHLLTGTQPYEATNPVAVISNHLNATIPRISDRRPELAALDPVFAKVLAKHPEDRFSSSREFVAALRQAIQPAADPWAPMGQSGVQAAAEPTMAAQVFAAAPTRPAAAPDRPTQVASTVNSKMSKDERQAENLTRRPSAGEASLRPRDRDPVRRYVRDIVDGRFNLLRFFLPLSLLLIIAILADPKLAYYAPPFTLLLALIMFIDGFRLVRRVNREVAAKFPDNKENLPRLGFYAVSRAMWSRR